MSAKMVINIMVFITYLMVIYFYIGFIIEQQSKFSVFRTGR